MREPRVLHTGERFHIVPPQVITRFAVFAGILWAVLALGPLSQYLWPRPAGERLTESGDFIYALIYAAGFSLICLGLLPGLATVVVVGKAGLALERWGTRVWHLPWDQLQGWRREMDNNGDPVGLLFVDRQGRSRRVGLGYITLSPTYYDSILAAVRAHDPDVQELPETQVFRVSPGCLAALALVAFFALLFIAFSTLRWR